MVPLFYYTVKQMHHGPWILTKGCHHSRQHNDWNTHQHQTKEALYEIRGSRVSVSACSQSWLGAGHVRVSTPIRPSHSRCCTHGHTHSWWHSSLRSCPSVSLSTIQIGINPTGPGGEVTILFFSCTSRWRWKENFWDVAKGLMQNVLALFHFEFS